MIYSDAVLVVGSLALLPSLTFMAWHGARRAMRPVPSIPAPIPVPTDDTRTVERLVATALIDGTATTQHASGAVIEIIRAPYGWRVRCAGREIGYVGRPQEARGVLLAALRGLALVPSAGPSVVGPEIGVHLTRLPDGTWSRRRVRMVPLGAAVLAHWGEVDLTASIYHGPGGLVVLDGEGT